MKKILKAKRLQIQFELKRLACCMCSGNCAGLSKEYDFYEDQLDEINQKLKTLD